MSKELETRWLNAVVYGYPIAKEQTISGYQVSLAKEELTQLENFVKEHTSKKESKKLCFPYDNQETETSIKGSGEKTVEETFTLDQFSESFLLAAKKVATVDAGQDFEDYVLDIISDAKNYLKR